jgi:hypothetical protein
MSKPIVLGRQQRFFEIPADAALVVVWVAIAFSEGLSVGLRYGWVLAIGLVHGTWVLRMRLQLRGRRLELPLVGPWRRAVDLDSLESKGTMLVRDRTGRRVPIYVGRFTGSEVWSKILLEAAERSGAMIDDHSRHLLSTATTASD